MATDYRIAAVVLAAGSSRRMGRPKPLLDAGGGETFLARILRTAQAAAFAPRLVVTHRALAPDLESEAAGATLLVNPDPGDGPITSIRVAIRWLDREPVDAIAVWPADHPYVTVASARCVREAGGAPIVVPRWEDRRGHPALFDRAVWPELRSPRADGGARAVVRADPGRVLEVESPDASVLLDIDTPREYRHAQRRLESDGARRRDATTGAD